jgi:AcrR family transcriptional regulator
MTAASADARTRSKRPTQARSIATFTSILDAATEIVVELGIQGLNTNIVAERARINIGTVYHYFPDKTAILLELFRLDQQQRAVYLHQKYRELPTAPDLGKWATETFALALRLRTERPATALLRRAYRSVPELVEYDEQDTAQWIEFLSQVLRERFGALSEARARHAASVMIETASAIFDSPDAAGRQAQAFLAEAVTMITSYLRTLERS